MNNVYVTLVGSALREKVKSYRRNEIFNYAMDFYWNRQEMLFEKVLH